MLQKVDTSVRVTAHINIMTRSAFWYLQNLTQKVGRPPYDRIV